MKQVYLIIGLLLDNQNHSINKIATDAYNLDKIKHSAHSRLSPSQLRLKLHYNSSVKVQCCKTDTIAEPKLEKEILRRAKDIKKYIIINPIKND